MYLLPNPVGQRLAVRMGGIKINGLPVGIGGDSRVISGFGPALDLKAGDTRL